MTEDELKEIESKAISSWHRIPDLIAEIQRLQEENKMLTDAMCLYIKQTRIASRNDCIIDALKKVGKF